MLDPILGGVDQMSSTEPDSPRAPDGSPTDDLLGRGAAGLIASMRPADAEGVPELHEVDVPGELREQIEDGDVALPAAALGGDPGAVGGPAPLRLVLARRAFARRPR